MLTMRECIDAQESAFAQLLTGGAIGRPRIDPPAVPGPRIFSAQTPSDLPKISFRISVVPP